MKFRTEYFPQKADFFLEPRNPILLVGSCFTQNISSKMKEHLWNAVTPCGTLYNPVSIAFAIDLMCDLEKGRERFEKTLFHHNGLWHSSRFDSSFSARDKYDCISDFSGKQLKWIEALENKADIIITLGTSICYYLKEEEMPVGNCHKLPSDLFYTKRLEVEEVTSHLDPSIAKLKDRWPDIRIILTVSPVRHLKDGFIQNNRSKAVLALAIEKLCEKHKCCSYFPAYEIINDDLRDYRFYAADLAHPSEQAIQYVWEKFLETYIDSRGMKILEDGAKNVRQANHRPMTGALGKVLGNP